MLRQVAERPSFDPSHTVAGTTVDGRFLPAAVVADTPVRSNGRLYVQAGAFTVYDNANRLRARLSDLGLEVHSWLSCGRPEGDERR